MEVRFLYTTEKNWKKSTNKNGSVKSGINHYVTVKGESYSECLSNAKNECGFNDEQLLGSDMFKYFTK